MDITAEQGYTSARRVSESKGKKKQSGQFNNLELSLLSMDIGRYKTDYSYQYLAFGGGRQSTAVAILNAESKLKDPTMDICFADTGSEMPETYEFLYGPWTDYCKKVGLNFHITRRQDYDDREQMDSLEHFSLYHATVPSVIVRWCTDRFKRFPQKEWLKENGHNPNTTVSQMGIASEEISRVPFGYAEVGTLQAETLFKDFKNSTHMYRLNQERINNTVEHYRELGMTFQGYSLGGNDYKTFVVGRDRKVRYPLLELGLTTSDCLDVIKKAGFKKLPVKSGCWFCPFQSPAKWLELFRVHPDLFFRALELEANAMAALPIPPHKHEEVRLSRIERGNKPMRLPIFKYRLAELWQMFQDGRFARLTEQDKEFIENELKCPDYAKAGCML